MKLFQNGQQLEQNQKNGVKMVRKRVIIATVTVNRDGGTSVAYTTEDDTAATNKCCNLYGKQDAEK